MIQETLDQSVLPVIVRLLKKLILSNFKVTLRIMLRVVCLIEAGTRRGFFSIMQKLIEYFLPRLGLTIKRHPSDV